MKIKIGDQIFDAATSGDICIMMTEQEHGHIAGMPPKDGPRFYGIYSDGKTSQAKFEADQKALEAFAE